LLRVLIHPLLALLCTLRCPGLGALRGGRKRAGHPAILAGAQQTGMRAAFKKLLKRRLTMKMAGHKLSKRAIAGIRFAASARAVPPVFYQDFYAHGLF
jgi:hypothetical protein